MPCNAGDVQASASKDAASNRAYLSFILPRGATKVVTVGRTGSLALEDAGLGGELSFLGFLDSLLVFC